MGILALASATTNQLIAAGAVLAGALIASGINVVNSAQARKDRKAEATAARRQRAGVILGRVRLFLIDIDPVRITFNLNAESTPKEFEALRVRLDALRDELSIFAASDDDDRLTDRTPWLEVALSHTFQQVASYVNDMLGHDADALPSLVSAQQAHLRALLHLRIVSDVVRGRDVAELDAALARLDGETDDDADKSA